MQAFDPKILSDVSNLATMTKTNNERKLRRLGRIPEPMIRRKGEAGFRPISWENTIEEISSRIKAVSDPKRLAFYLVSRGTVNETYYVAQKVARLLGTNNMDNSARICHAPSTTALRQTIGYAATTCSYSDLIGSDILAFIGSNVANNQPVMMKYLHVAKKVGTKIAVINPFLEKGMQKYWVPSSVDSAILGTKIADYFFQISVGGDIAFLNGVLKYLIANDWVDHKFIEQHTSWNELVSELQNQSFEDLVRSSGVKRERMLEFAQIYSQARTAIFIWSMGISMHSFGISNVKSIVNLALARGMIGRSRTGLMPIRGHSGVQGGAKGGRFQIICREEFL